MIVVAESKNAQASANGSLPDGASGTVGGGSGGGGGGGHDWPGDFEALSPPDDPEALPRLGWYVYLFTKDVLGFRSSNAAFVKCLQVLLASLGVVIWNASAIQRASCCTPTSSDHQEASKRNASNVVVGKHQQWLKAVAVGIRDTVAHACTPLGLSSRTILWVIVTCCYDDGRRRASRISANAGRRRLTGRAALLVSMAEQDSVTSLDFQFYTYWSIHSIHHGEFFPLKVVVCRLFSCAAL